MLSALFMTFPFKETMKPVQAKQKRRTSDRAKRLALLFCMLPNVLSAQKDVIVFHNCENFFYPTKDSLTQDDDFTAMGRRHWTFERYNRKKNSLAKTYIAAGAGTLPSLIGLCEVENDRVLSDLCTDTPLRKGGYRFIHYDSEDLRGIDVALLYMPSRFKPLEHYKITHQASSDEDKTRDVLYVQGLLGEVRLNIYVVHAPSRRDHNIKKVLRQEIFSAVYKHIEDLRSKGEKHFIVMGDMNDNPWDKAVEAGFRTRRTSQNPSPILVNLMQNNKNKTGSYIYNGEYLGFDQFLVSEELFALVGRENESHILQEDFLIDPDPKKSLLTPYSTYKGLHYQGGVSDHFPIILTIDPKADTVKASKP